MLSSKDIAKHFELTPLLNPKEFTGPMIVCIGVCPTPSFKELKKPYGIRTLACSAEHLESVNTGCSDYIMITAVEADESQALKHLWRIAREGATVIIINSEQLIAKPEVYGIFQSNQHTAYRNEKLLGNFIVGVMRRDTAVEFAR